MAISVPSAVVPVAPRGFAADRRNRWNAFPRYHLVRAEDGAPPRQSTVLRMAADGGGLWVDLRCEDAEPWATQRRRDAPLWEEEVIEVFLGLGDEPPRQYFEVQVNPLGTIFDATVSSPDGTRAHMTVDSDWHWPGIEARATIEPGEWRVWLRLPWPSPAWPEAGRFRGNFYRIDRPSDGPPEHSAWSPTLRTPADFHVPARFGRLRLAGQSPSVSDR